MIKNSGSVHKASIVKGSDLIQMFTLFHYQFSNILFISLLYLLGGKDNTLSVLFQKVITLVKNDMFRKSNQFDEKRYQRWYFSVGKWAVFCYIVSWMQITMHEKEHFLFFIRHKIHFSDINLLRWSEKRDLKNNWKRWEVYWILKTSLRIKESCW